MPLLAFAWTNIALQRAGPTEHSILGHYGHMAAFSFTVIAVGVLSSLRPDGWRITAFVAVGQPLDDARCVTRVAPRPFVILWSQTGERMMLRP